MNALDWFYRESFLNHYDEVPAVKLEAPKTCVVEQWDEATQSWKEHIVVLDSEAK